MDGAPGSEAVIINERLAKQFFAGEDPIGRRLRFRQREPPPASPGLPAPSAPVWRTIIGITPSIRHGSPQDAYLNAVVYLPYRQESPSAASLLVRSGLAPGSVMDAVRREVQAIVRTTVFTSRQWTRCDGESLAVPRLGSCLRSALSSRSCFVGGSLRGDGVLGDAGTQEIECVWRLARRGDRCPGDPRAGFYNCDRPDARSAGRIRPSRVLRGCWSR